MIDHTGIGVADVARSAQFYDAVLGALGWQRVAQLPAHDGADAVAYGLGSPRFWIDRFHPHSVKQHTAFVARSRAQVVAFHAAAIAAGGTDNGLPGLRDTTTGYPPGYYAAFVLDPDGNNIEAVLREPTSSPNAIEMAVANYIRAWSERDPALRASLLEACFAPEGRIVTRSREICGRAALAEAIARFVADPQFQRIRLLSALDASGTTFRVRAAVDFLDGRSLEGFDAGEVDSTGKISLILTFAGPLADAEAATKTEAT